MSKCFLVVYGECADLPHDDWNFIPKPSKYCVISAWPDKAAADKDCEQKATSITYHNGSSYRLSTDVWTHSGSGTFYCVIEVPSPAVHIKEKEIPYAPKKVELRGAFVWDCDDCGRENFCTGPPVIQEEIDEIIEEYAEVEDLHGFHFAEMPETVTCKYCGEIFETQNPTKTELDEDDEE